MVSDRDRCRRRKKPRKCRKRRKFRRASCAELPTSYCEDTLKRTEEAVALSLDEVRKARQRFKSIAKYT